jgi:MFS family permease
LGAANVIAAQAYVTDTSEGKARTVGLARLAAAVTAGLLLGPVFGGFLAEWGGNFALGLTAACASALGAMWLIFGLPNKPPVVEAQTGAPAQLAPLLRGRPELIRLFVVAASGWFAIACLEGTFGRLIHARLGYGQLEFGIILGWEAAIAILVQAFLLPWLLKRNSEYGLLRASYIMQGIGLAMFPFMPGMAMLLLASSIHGIGMGGSGPVISGLASQLSPQERQGELFGLLQAGRSVGFLIGPLIGGLLFDWNHSAPYLGAAAILLGIIVLSPRPPRAAAAVQ